MKMSFRFSVGLVVGVLGVSGLVGGGRAEIALPEPPAGRTGAAVIAVPPPRSSDDGTVTVPAVDADRLRFRNGDVLHGTLVGATPAGGLRWRRSDVREPIAFGLDSIYEVRLWPRAIAAEPATVRVELTNGDLLAGQLRKLDEQVGVLQTWYAGVVTLKRAVVQRLIFLRGEATALYRGPNNLEEWKREGGSRGAWVFQKGALVASGGGGTLGREMALPAAASIEFDLAWRGALYVNVGFGFDDPRQIYNSGGYMVQFSQQQVFLNRHRPQRGSNIVGTHSEVPALQRQTRTRVQLRYSKDKKLVMLALDGKLVRQWNEPEDWAAKGGCLVFVNQGPGQFRISNLVVTSWDGRVEEEPTAGSDAEDLVRLTNGDKVSGRVKQIEKDQVILSTSFAEMNIPVGRVSGIEFGSARMERARRQPEDVRAMSADGHRLTLALERLDEQHLVGTSDNFGKLTAALGAFRTIQFRIYEKPPPGEEDDVWGGGEVAPEE